MSSELGFDEWYIAQSARCKTLLAAGRYLDAENILAEILAHLGEVPSYRRCIMLDWLGRCYDGRQQATRAEAVYRQALTEADRLEQMEGTRKLVGTLQSDLGTALLHLGRFKDARAAHQASLATQLALGDERGAAVSLGQLAAIALREGNFGDAELGYRQAIDAFRSLRERCAEATCWHQLGNAYLQMNHFDQAEQALRESARIKEETGDRVGLSNTWHQLARLMQDAGRPGEAEDWYLKALTVQQAEGDRVGESKTHTNLADLLTNLPNRLADAKLHAEQALAIKKTQDPAAAEIWKTYGVLANIAGRQGDADAARDWHREERASYAAAPVSEHRLRSDQPFIAAVVQAVCHASARPALDPILADAVADGWTGLVDALRRIVDGERDEEVLCASLNYEDWAIVAAVLRGITNPAP